jgi:hypothetical protein
MLSLQQSQRARGQNRVFPEEVGKGGEMGRDGTMYTHVGKYKNDKRKEKVFECQLIP